MAGQGIAQYSRPRLFARAGVLAAAISMTSGLMLLGDVAAAPNAETAKRATSAAADGVWRAIDAKSSELKKSIASGALDQVHHEAFAIRDLVAALVTRSPALTADKLAKVKTAAKFVATLADRLDTTGDAKDLAGTKQNYEKLTTILRNLRANYAD